MATEKHRLRIVELRAGLVVCEGRFPTADGKGLHKLLRPVIHDGEIAWLRPPRVGDMVAAFDDGSYRHLP